MKSEIRVLGKARSVQAEVAAPERRGEAVDDKPRSVYEIVTRRMLEELKEDVGEVKGRVNALLWLVAGAVVMELVMRLVT